MDIDIKKIGKFLMDVDGAEFLYLKHIVDFRFSLEDLIKSNGLTKSKVCEVFKLSPKQYTSFVMGNYNYSIDDMARLNYTWRKYEIEKLKDQEPIRVAK